MWTHADWVTHCNAILHYFANNCRQLERVLGRQVGLPMLPPPPRNTRIELLFVGHSPKLLVNNLFGKNAQQAFARAMDLRYVGSGTAQQVHPYYRPLVSLAQCVSQEFGVWWQVEEAHVALRKVEFVDICHLPFKNDKELKKLWGTTLVPGFKEQCHEWLMAEIQGMNSPLVVCNGAMASASLRQLAQFVADFNPCTDAPHFHSEVLRAHVHLSGFMTSARPLDQFNKARITREIRDCMA